jgi:CheY-like chemotaxis protein
VQLVPDGEAAVHEYARAPYDLVLLDAHMVEPDCATAARALRHAPVAWARRSPIVAMTAWLEQGDHERFLEAGMNDHLPKPVTLDRLRDLLERWTPDAAPSHDAAA